MARIVNLDLIKISRAIPYKDLLLTGISKVPRDYKIAILSILVPSLLALYFFCENRKLTESLNEQSIISQSPSVGYLWDSNYKYHVYYPIEMSPEERAKKLQSRFNIKNISGRTFSDFKVIVLFSYEQELYSKPLSNVKSIPIINWSPDNTGKILDAGKEISFDLFEALTKKGICLLALFPDQDNTYMQSKNFAEANYRFDQKKLDMLPQVDNSPPLFSSFTNKQKYIYFRIIIEFNCDNRLYRHVLAGRTGISFTDENSQATKAMWVSDYFFKPDYSEIKIPGFDYRVIKIPVAVYNSTHMIKEFYSTDYQYICVEATDNSNNTTLVCSWLKEMKEKYYFNLSLLGNNAK